MHSIQGEGNTWLLVLPVSTEWQTEKLEIDEDESPRSGDKVFLLLEDNYALVKSLSRVLRQRGYKWLTASSSGEVLTLADQYCVQGLFAGSQWHNREGLELLDTVSKKVFPRRIPFCSLSGSEESGPEWQDKFMG